MRSDGLGLAEARPVADFGAAVAERVQPVARCDVAVIGAGPYGLAAAAHLRTTGMATRAFGQSMAFWRRNMPKGMKLRHATGISHPTGSFSLEAFASVDPMAAIRPLPIETFIAYAEWFQQQAVPNLDRRKVTRVAPAADGFALQLEGGEVVEAGRVVVALGLKNQDFRPAQFVGLPERLVSHLRHMRSSHHYGNSRRANRIRHAISLRNHSGHGADADQSNIVIAHKLRDPRLIHRLSVAVDEQHLMAYGSERLQKEHPEMRHKITSDAVVWVV